MKKQILTLALLGSLLVAGGILMLTGRAQVSQTERRQLAQWPPLTLHGLRSGSFMADAEQAAADQFPQRDRFRQLKAQFLYGVLRQKDNNGIYLRGNSAAKLDYPLDERSLTHAIERIGHVQERYLQGMNCYYSIIPDKNYFLAGYCPTMDYAALQETLAQSLSMTYIDLFPCLQRESYYDTDPHWRQEALEPVVNTLAEAMGVSLTWDFSVQAAGDFLGAYAGQSGLQLQPDELCYFTGEILDGCTARDLNGEIPIYDSTKVHGRDPYEFFLCGASPIQVLNNPAAPTDRELIVFRDSFGSSLVPLLVSGYHNITLIDLRYISSDLLDEYVTFDNQDVLFLYSTLLWNHSETLK